MIQSAVKNTLSILKINNAAITVTPKTITIENITKSEAEKIQAAFNKAGMKTLGVTDLNEIEMGEGFEISIVI